MKNGPPFAVGPYNPVQRIQVNPNQTLPPEQLLTQLVALMDRLTNRLAPPLYKQVITFDGKSANSIIGATNSIQLTGNGKVNGLMVWLSQGIVDLSIGGSQGIVPTWRWDASLGSIPPYNVFFPEFDTQQLVYTVDAASPTNAFGAITLLEY